MSKGLSLHPIPVLASVLVAVHLVAGDVIAQAGDTITDPEAYRVYASILPITFSSGDTDLSRIALLRETRSRFACPRVRSSGNGRALGTVTNGRMLEYAPFFHSLISVYLTFLSTLPM